ncbi:MAG TPA: AlpA family phage regulatory protein [Phenylobacterium sp.]|nr:AlpA family phage regulatory protein [Phenylobacterium sp.]
MSAAAPRRWEGPEAWALRTVRRTDLRRIVPLADTTIYELEQRGQFPRRFNLTARCVVWDLGEIEAWLVERRRASESEQIARAPYPDVRKRRSRPCA